MPLTHDDATKAGERVYAKKGCSTFCKPDPNPKEVYPSFAEQMFGTDTPVANQVANMSGFLQNYRKVKGNPDPNGVMECYTPDQLPVISKLAREYAVCDRWFASAPLQTWPMRSFLHAGTSFGRLNNCNGKDEEDCIPNFAVYAGKRTIFDVLDENHILWRLYQEPGGILPTITSSQFWTVEQKSSRFARPLKSLGDDLAQWQAPKYIFIEPHYYAGNRQAAGDQHPPADMRGGERLLASIYNTLAKSPVWNKTVLLVTYDEHGGCYDHVPPPTTIRPDAFDNQFAVGSFDPFTILGPRVPTLLISPYVEPGTVFRGTDGTEFEHTSVLSSIRDWLFSPEFPMVGGSERVLRAPTIWPVLTRSTARTDKVDLAGVPKAPTQSTSDGGQIAPTLIGTAALAEADRLIVEELSASDRVGRDPNDRYAELAEERYRALRAGSAAIPEK